jgi:Zn-dependent protease
MTLSIIFSIIILIFSVILHEVSHGYMADYLGDPTARLLGRLTLNPIPHIDIMGSIVLPILFVLTPGAHVIFGWAKPVPYNPRNITGTPFKDRYGGAIVAIAGPLVNIVIAVFFGLIIRFLVSDPNMIDFFKMIVVINISLALFNLIPIPPLDGHHILAAILPYNIRQKYLELSRYSIILIFIVAFVLWQFISPLVLTAARLLTGL